MIRIAIDPNVRVHGNQTYAGFEDIDGPVPRVGEPVTVHEPESSLSGTAHVARVDEKTLLVYLEVDWSALRPQPSNGTVAQESEPPATREVQMSNAHRSTTSNVILTATVTRPPSTSATTTSARTRSKIAPAPIRSQVFVH